MFSSLLIFSATSALPDDLIRHRELPDAIIGFALSIRQDNEFLKRLNTNQQTKIDKLYFYVDSKISNIDDIHVFLSFSNNYCKILSEYSGYFCDNTKQKDPGGYLYVTTPITTFDENIIVVTSSQSPERTQFIAIPAHGNSHILYDSFSKTNKCSSTDVDYPLRVIYSIQVYSEGVFRMRESGNLPLMDGEREISLTLSNEKCEIRGKTIRTPGTNVDKNGAQLRTSMTR